MDSPAMTLPRPCLCLVTDRRLCQGGSLEERVRLAIEGGVHMVQLREKEMAAGELFELARRLREATLGRCLFAVNDRLDVALAVRADAVHLPENGLPVGAVRQLAGGRMLVGRSVHSVEAAVQAEREGADYLIVGTIFETASHPGKTPEGLGLLADVLRRCRLPVLGIGGINAANVWQVLRAGAGGAAVISAILGAADPQVAARELANAMRTALEAERVRG